MDEKAIKKIIFLLFCLIILLPGPASAQSKFVRAEVLSSRNERGPISKDLFRYLPQVQYLSLKILSGSHRGEIVSFDNQLVGHRGYDIFLYPGDKVLVQITTTPSGEISSLSLVSHIRDRFILLLIFSFLLSLVLMGGLKKGLLTALSLILTLGLVFFIMLPLLKLGFPPLLVGVLISIIAAALTLYLIGGGGVKSLSAILSTIVGVLIVGGLALVGAHFMRLNGYHMEESKTLVFYLHHALTCRLSDLRGLLLVGIIIGGLGVMMDVAISMASSVYEIRGAHPGISQKELVKRSMNVGRDIMATMANSLILAYLGLTLPLILTFMIMGTPFLRISNWAFLDVEILAALAGSIGFVLVIPLTVMITTTLLYKRIPFSRIKRTAIILLVLLAMGTGVHARDGGELLPESELRTHPLVFIKEREEEFVRGKVLAIERKGLEKEIITFKVLGGRYKNRVVEVPNYLTGRRQYDLLFKEGDQALLRLSQEEFFIADYIRDRFLFVLAGVFIALLILVGRAKGLRTALALGITLALIFFLFLPLIRLGFPPLPLSILVSILATLFTLYLVAGFGVKGHCAILGTSLGVLIAALLSLGAKEILNALLGTIMFHNPGDLNVLKARLVELLSILSRSAVEGGVDIHLLLEKNLYYINKVMEIDTQEDLCAWISNALNDFIESVYASQDARKITQIKPAVDFIETGYDQPIILADVAKAVHLSISRLAHLFKEQMGITIIEYLTNVRIRHAKQLLLATDKSCTEICFKVGFNNQSYFTRTFKEIVGMTPRQFRESNRRPRTIEPSL